jgi:hypothetical protein
MSPKFEINAYIQSLPLDILAITIPFKDLEYIPSLLQFFRLKTLNCEFNYLKSLPELPASVKYIHCCMNKITSLPARLPPGLVFMACGRNRITELPVILPPSLTGLYCYDNLISVMPPLPPNMEDLRCGKNPLIRLPKLSDCALKTLQVGNTLITSLPELPPTLLHIEYAETPVYNVFCGSNMPELIRASAIVHRFRRSYHAARFRANFRYWLWHRVRRPKLEEKYSPANLLALLACIPDSADGDEFQLTIDEW